MKAGYQEANPLQSEKQNQIKLLDSLYEKVYERLQYEPHRLRSKFGFTDSDDVEGFLHEGYLKARRCFGSGRFEGEKSEDFLKLLRKILNDHAIDMKRKKKRLVSLEEFDCD